jgi:hypothetical protein
VSLRYVPSAPINLKREETLTTTTQISLTWDNGSSDGNSPILDYTIFYD